MHTARHAGLDTTTQQGDHSHRLCEPSLGHYIAGSAESDAPWCTHALQQMQAFVISRGTFRATVWTAGAHSVGMACPASNVSDCTLVGSAGRHSFRWPAANCTVTLRRFRKRSSVAGGHLRKYYASLAITTVLYTIISSFMTVFTVCSFRFGRKQSSTI